jgi:hypothetical protein
MASKTLGRVACPIACGHTAAFVKLKTDKEGGKAAYPYVHCAGCGVQMHTRSEAQARHLLAITRAEKGAEPALDAPGGPPGHERPPVDANPPPPVKKPAMGLFDGGIFGRAA